MEIWCRYAFHKDTPKDHWFQPQSLTKMELEKGQVILNHAFGMLKSEDDSFLEMDWGTLLVETLPITKKFNQFFLYLMEIDAWRKKIPTITER